MCSSLTDFNFDFEEIMNACKYGHYGIYDEGGRFFCSEGHRHTAKELHWDYAMYKVDMCLSVFCFILWYALNVVLIIYIHMVWIKNQ